PRPPPSFPTRRSSDLARRRPDAVDEFGDAAVGGVEACAVGPREGAVEELRAASQFLPDRGGERRSAGRVDVAALQQREPLRILQDRKSTRLNSSHVSI